MGAKFVILLSPLSNGISTLLKRVFCSSAGIHIVSKFGAWPTFMMKTSKEESDRIPYLILRVPTELGWRVYDRIVTLLARWESRTRNHSNTRAGSAHIIQST